MTETIKGYNESAQIIYEIPYKNGRRHGIQRGWYENGQLRWMTSYQNGLRHGKNKWWSKDGHQEIKEYYLYGGEVSEEEYRKHQLIGELACLK